MFISNCELTYLDDSIDKFIVCTGECVFSHKLYSVIITEEEYIKIVINGEHIQDVIPHASASDREFLISGISPFAWGDVFFFRSGDDEKYEISRTHNIWKKDWKFFEAILKKYKIEKLYHFTDKSNINCIKENNGLYSWYYCKNNKLLINKPGGSDASRRIDEKYSLENYVRLSFSREHPMMYVAKKDGRIPNPVIIEIDTKVCFSESTLFSDMNAVKNNHNCGGGLIDFNKVRFDIVTKKNHFDIDDKLDKPFYQEEILIRTHLPINYFLNLKDL